ncbi:hypothetical protein QQ054_00810 [Oscillatoria amoena NRMC-F 0135]|nr:hypothetical protein [Oscillatoria amoena NRMC-F 0135]
MKVKYFFKKQQLVFITIIILGLAGVLSGYQIIGLVAFAIKYL